MFTGACMRDIVRALLRGRCARAAHLSAPRDAGLICMPTEAAASRIREGCDRWANA